MSKKLIKITTPRGTVAQKKLKNGRVTATLTWNRDFGNDCTERFDRIQKWIDNECLKRCDPLTPFDSGILKMSGNLFTVFGSGELIYSAPYAARLYYNPQFHFNGAPQRGGMWFERMKKEGGKEAILLGAKKLAGKK